MKTILKASLTCFILCLFYLQNSYAQNYPIQVTVVATPPYPFLVSDYLTRTGETVLILTNTDPFNTYETKIGVEATGDNGLKIVSNWTKQPLESIKIGPLETRSFTANELLELYSNHNPNDISYAGIELTELAQSQTLPEGIYTACVQVLDFNTDEYLSIPAPGGCTPPIPILGLDPPIIVSPQEGETVEMQSPQFIPFQWTAVAGAQAMINYRVRIVEVFDNVNPYDAMESDNFLIFEEKDLVAPIKLYDAAAPLLEEGRVYAVQVTAYDPSGTTLLRNEGKSDVVWFKYNRRQHDRPVFFSPVADAELDLALDAGVNFAWSMSDAPSAEYTLRVFEQPEGMSPYDVLAEDDKYLLHQETNLFSPYFYWDTSTANLEPTKTYVAFVTAYDPFGFYQFQGLGNSYPLNFTIQGIESEDTIIELPPGEENPPTTQLTPPLGNFDCANGCTAALPQDNQAITTAQVGSTLRVGNFLVDLDEVNWTGLDLSGQGRVRASERMPAAIRVELNGVQVNAQNEVFAGEVRAAHNQAFLQVDWLNEEGIFNPQWNGNAADFLNDVANFATSVGEAFDPQINTGVSLPLQFASPEATVVITGINFTPTGATYNLLSYGNLPGDINTNEQLLIFSAEEMCFSPAGFTGSGEAARMNLARSVTYTPSDNYQVKFNRGLGETGTYARFDCEGFVDMVLNGTVIFNRDLLIPVNADSESMSGNTKLSANFSAVTTDIADMVLELSISSQVSQVGQFAYTPYFQLASLPDFRFRLKDLSLDASDFNNPENIVFPTDYPETAETWRGIYFKEMEMKFPVWLDGQEESGQLTLSNFFLDAQGFTGQVSGENIIPLSPGDQAAFDFSVESFTMEYFQSDLRNGNFSGRVKMPLFDQNIGYSTNMNFNSLSSELDFDFDLDTEGINFPLPMWYADMQIADVDFDLGGAGEDYNLTFFFDGFFDFEGNIGDFDNFSLSNIRFEHFGLSFDNNTGSFDFNLPSISLDGTPGGEFMGFDFVLNDIDFESPVGLTSLGDIARLNLDLNLELGGPGQGITVNGVKFNIDGLIKTSPGISFEFFGADLESINLDVDVAGLDMEGSLNTFTNHNIYGDGVAGTLDVHLAGIIETELEAKFGSAQNSQEKYNYWYVDGDVDLPTGVPFVTPLDLYGFGGGAYYNVMSNTRRPNGGGTFGIRAGIDVALTPTAMMFNGEFDLTADFNMKNGFSLNTISLSGNARALQSPDSPKSETAPISLAGNITYNHTIPELSANLNFDLLVPPSAPLLTGSGDFNFLFNPDKWFLHLGHPQDMVNVSMGPKINMFGKRVSLGSLDFNSYFVSGGGNSYTLPALPALPSQLDSDVRKFVQQNRNFPNADRGFVVGLHNSFDYSISKKIDLYIAEPTVYFYLNGGAGTDLSLGQYSAACGSKTSYGINNWYATGQGYLYLNGEVGVRIYRRNYGVGLGLSAAGSFGLPNPTSLRAAAAIRVRLGPASLRYNTTISMGSSCDFDEGDLQEGLIRSIAMIRSCSIEEGAELETLHWSNIQAEVDLHFNQSERFGEETYTIWIESDDVKLKKKTGTFFEPEVSGLKMVWRNDIEAYQIQQDPSASEVILESDTEYTLQVTAKLVRVLALGEEGSNSFFGNDMYEPVFLDGKPVRDTLTVNFKTAVFGNTITTPISSRPANRQRYFHKGDSVNGEVVFENPYLTAGFNMSGKKIVAVFTDLGTMNQHTVDVTYNQNAVNGLNSKFTFSTAELQPGQRYKVRFSLVSTFLPSVAIHTFYEYYFAVSKYDTFQAKTNALYTSLEQVHSEYSNYAEAEVESYTLNLHCDEGFEESEVEQLLGRNRTEVLLTGQNEWISYRRILEDKNGIAPNLGQASTNYPSSAYELFLEPMGSLMQGPMSDNDLFGGETELNLAFDLNELAGTNQFVNNNTFSGPNINLNSPVYTNPAPEFPPALKLRWDVNEYTASLRHALLQLEGNDMPSFETIEELEAIYGPYQPASAGTYNLRWYITFGQTRLLKSYPIEIE